MELEKLAKIITDAFGPPFLPEGFVRAEMTAAGTLRLIIGPRDVELDENIRWLSSGSWLTEEWLIEKAQIES